MDAAHQMTMDAKWWQKLTWPFESGQLNN